MGYDKRAAIMQALEETDRMLRVVRRAVKITGNNQLEAQDAAVLMADLGDMEAMQMLADLDEADRCGY